MQFKKIVFCCFWMESPSDLRHHFKTSIFLFIFCLDDLSIDVSGVLKSPTIFVLLSISPFLSVNTCFMYLVAPMLDVYIFVIIISSPWIDPLIIM